MKKKSKIQGMLILTGLADPCGEQGKEGRYDLLPYPWTTAEFNSCVQHMAAADKWLAYAEELDPVEHPTGVRFWFCVIPECRPLELLHEEHTHRRWKKAGRLVDHITTQEPIASQKWEGDKHADNPAKIAKLETLILQTLKLRASQLETPDSTLPGTTT